LAQSHNDDVLVKKNSTSSEVNQAINLKLGPFCPKSTYKKEKKKEINLVSRVCFFNIPLPLKNVWSLVIVLFLCKAL
jgi:hypothetical protein